MISSTYMFIVMYECVYIFFLEEIKFGPMTVGRLKTRQYIYILSESDSFVDVNINYYILVNLLATTIDLVYKDINKFT